MQKSSPDKIKQIRLAERLYLAIGETETETENQYKMRWPRKHTFGLWPKNRRNNGIPQGQGLSTVSTIYDRRIWKFLLPGITKNN